MLFQNSKHPIELKVTHLNKVYDHRKEQLALATKDSKTRKTSLKNALADKFEKVKNRKSADKKPTGKVYALDFHGDIKASHVLQLREEITALLTNANAGDEVVVRLESGGGLVHSYGLAAAQLARVKDAGLTLTVCVDKIAASGGYMMACVADTILAAPFAVVGSIGVVAQVPNFHDLLEKHDIDVDVFTAGKYKRTVTIFGKNDDEDKQKFQEELEQTHVLFKDFINQYRPQLDLEKVATGEHWYGSDALALNLVDKLQTSDSYLLEKIQGQQVYALHSRQKPTIAEKLGFGNAAHATFQGIVKMGVGVAVDTLAEKLPEALMKVEQGKKF